MADLAHVLRQLPQTSDANLLAGSNPADDAAVYRVRDDLALIQTVDFFTPIVDDPYTYGMIAAANSLSDVYAMGGTPLTALNIAAFPTTSMPKEILGEILRGGAAKAAEAGIPIIGGHTIDDADPKYGLAVTGIVDPNRFITSHHAQIGDRLILTKPLGTGVIATALKAGAVSPAHAEQAVRWMTTLNRSASVAMLAAGANASTDVTGYGLLGHLLQLCTASHVSALVYAGSIPLLSGAWEYARDGHVPSGTHTNLSYLDRNVVFSSDIDDVTQTVLADPQTSGGLLLCIPESRLEKFLQAAQTDMLTAEIGRISHSREGTVTVE